MNTTNDLKEKLIHDGVVVVPGFVTNDVVETVRLELEALFADGLAREVDEDGIKIQTINGDELLSRSDTTVAQILHNC